MKASFSWIFCATTNKPIIEAIIKNEECFHDFYLLAKMPSDLEEILNFKIRWRIGEEYFQKSIEFSSDFGLQFS